jgi:glyoxylase-like metal-dependent hydrolase (beta-lactamase superfamily II)
MRIHHLNCGTMCPLGGRLMYGDGPHQLVCHCLLVELGSTLVLVDTGFGTEDVRAPRERLSGFFLALDRIRLDPVRTALARVRALGFAPEDVGHIVMTHLDFDHAGGIADFPRAQIHLHRREDAAARRREGMIARRRYRPSQWDGGSGWHSYVEGGEPWQGFAAVRQLAGLPPELLLIPLHGHTDGHCGVAIDTGAGWLLHAGDAFFDRHEIAAAPSCPPGKALYQRMMATDFAAVRHNRAWLRALAQEQGFALRVFCSHDAAQYRMLAGGASAS